MHHELNVNELVAILAMGQSRISRHLKILTDCGLLSSRRDGLRVFYRARNQGSGARVIEAVTPLLAGEEVFDQDQAQAGAVIQQRAEATRRFFNSIADKWDRLRSDVLGELDLALAVTSRMPDSTVAVDLGCGTGEMLPALLAKARQVIGVDSSAKMLDLARQRLDGEGKRVSLRIGELEHLPLADGEADFAVASMALHHLSQPIDGLIEAHRILKPGGRLVVAEFEQHRNESMRSQYGDQWLGFSYEKLSRWLHRAGFTIKHNERRPVHQGLTVQIISVKKPSH